jgi:hypothetical protein
MDASLVKRKENARGSHSVFLTFSQFYIEHDLRKNKIVVAFHQALALNLG